MFDLRKQILNGTHFVPTSQPGVFKARHSLALYDNSAIMCQVQVYRSPFECHFEFDDDRTIYLTFPVNALPKGLEVILIG